MSNGLAKEILKAYVFGDYNIESLYSFTKGCSDDVERKLYAEALLTRALQKGIIALNAVTPEEIRIAKV